MTLGDTHESDLIEMLQGFCILNDISWPEEKVSGQDAQTLFVKIIKRDWPSLNLQDLKASIAYWQSGSNTELRKPRKLTLHFFGQLISAWRSMNRPSSQVSQNKYNGSSEKPTQYTLEQRQKALKTSWQLQYKSWIAMCEGGCLPPWSKVMEIHDSLCLKHGIYKEGDFSNSELSKAKHDFFKADERFNKEKGKKEFKNVANIIKPKANQIDISAISRLGAHYNRICANGVQDYFAHEVLLNNC